MTAAIFKENAVKNANKSILIRFLIEFEILASLME